MTDRQMSEHTDGGSAVLRVLYVEDDELVRELTQELLLRADREVVACGSAFQWTSAGVPDANCCIRSSARCRET